MNVRRIVQYLPSAEADLASQAAYFATRDPGLIRRFALAVAHEAERMLAMPELGSKFPGSREDLRDLRISRPPRFPNHLIFYRNSAAEIEIVRILHAAQDWQSMFSE